MNNLGDYLEMTRSLMKGEKENGGSDPFHKKVLIHKMQMKTSLLIIIGLGPNKLIRYSHVIVANKVNYYK